MSRPAPKRRADISTVPADTESVEGRRSAKRKATTTRSSRPGARRAARPRRSLLPTPAVLGATALVIAGGGAVVVSSNSGGGDAVDPASTTQGNQVAASYARGGGVLPVSRGVDREVLAKQADLQAKQRARALAQLATESQKWAKELEANQWVLPVVGYQLTATWGEYSSWWSSYHTGLDFAAATGTEIVSVARGVVTFADWDGSYGYKAVVELEDGTMIWYCHQSDIAVEEGQEVNPGDLIGYVGDTGNTSGPHLHLEVRTPDGSEEGRDVDPYEALVEHGVTP